MINIENSEIKSRFTLGIDFMDEDYSDIFSNAAAAAALLQKNPCDKRALASTLIRIKDLTEKHFEAQEGYIRFEGSGSFMFHKHCHRIIKENLLPALMDETAVISAENAKKILGTFLGVFSAHILFEDGKLRDKKPVSLKPREKKDMARPEKSAAEALYDTAFIKSDLTDQDSDLCMMDDCIAYERTYNLDDKSHVRIKAAFEEGLIFSFMKDIFKIEIKEADALAVYTLLAFTREASKKLYPLFKVESSYMPESERLINTDDIEMSLMQKKPDHKLSFKVGSHHFIIFANKV